MLVLSGRTTRSLVSTSTSSNMFQIPKFAAQVVLSYMEVQSVTHCWRWCWWNLVQQPVLLFLDQFSTELPALNMLALLVGIAMQHIILKSRFSPPGFPSTVLCPTTPSGWAAPTSSSTGETSQPQSSIGMQLPTQFELIANISQPYTFAYSAARAPGAKPDRQRHFQYFPALSTRFQVCNARGWCKWSGSRTIRLSWSQLSVAAGQLFG